MILGVGDGTFAILFVAVFGIIATLIGAYIRPRLALPIGAVSLSLPFIVYGCILSAPRGPIPDPLPPTVYNRERQLALDDSVIDYFLPVRVVVMIILIMAILGALGYYAKLVICEPPSRAPRVRCLREQLEDLHPTWYR